MGFVKEDFTEEELKLLHMAFKLLDTALDEYDSLDYNYHAYQEDVHSLKEKMGIYNLIGDD